MHVICFCIRKKLRRYNIDKCIYQLKVSILNFFVRILRASHNFISIFELHFKINTVVSECDWWMFLLLPFHLTTTRYQRYNCDHSPGKHLFRQESDQIYHICKSSPATLSGPVQAMNPSRSWSPNWFSWLNIIANPALKRRTTIWLD